MGCGICAYSICSHLLINPPPPTFNINKRSLMTSQELRGRRSISISAVTFCPPTRVQMATHERLWRCQRLAACPRVRMTKEEVSE